MPIEKLKETHLRVVLIGGASHTGKSTLAESLASTPDWSATSTDSLARHPGRPWGRVRPRVANHYLSLSVEELITDLSRHYQSMWPGLRSLITRHATDPSADRLILEGSALRPESVATLDLDAVGAIWLTASDALLQQRIYRASGFEQAESRNRAMIEKFLGRTLRDNAQILETLRCEGLAGIDVEETPALDDLARKASARLF